MHPTTAQLLRALDQAYAKKSWHGTNLRGAIRGVSLDELAWRPRPRRHNIWELAVHCAYWKYAVWRRLTGAKRGSFPLEGSNFFGRPEARTSAAWRADVALLDAMHEQLRDSIAAFPGARWSRKPAASEFSFADLARGAAAHDLYHAGQIQLIKALRKAVAGSR